MEPTKSESPKAKQPIARFPRMPEHSIVAECAKGIWEAPDFSPDEVGGATQFIFAVRFRDRFQRRHSEIYRSLFKGRNATWMSALKQAYETPTSTKNAKSPKQLISAALYALFYEALLIVNKDTEGLRGDYSEFKKVNTEEFRKATNRKRGKPRDSKYIDSRAIRIVHRYEALIPVVRRLRKFISVLKKTAIRAEEELILRAEAKFEEKWMSFIADGTAFKRLPADEFQEKRWFDTTIGGKWAPWQLTLGILRGVEKRDHPQKALGVPAIRKALSKGRKLLGKSKPRP